MKKEINPDKVQYDLRFINLNEDLKDSLLAEFRAKNFDAEWNQMKNANTYTLWINIDEEINTELVSKIISNLPVEDEQYGIWVSFTSNFDNGGVRFPKYVTQLYKKIGGYIDFSYIIIAD